MQSGGVVSNVEDKIRAVYICNDENNPFGVHPHGPIAFVRGGSTTVSDHVGSFTNNSQKIVSQFMNRSLLANAEEAYYTPPTGKTLYITTLIVSTNSAGDTPVLISDNIGAKPSTDAGQTDMIEVALTTAFQSISVPLVVPFKVATVLNAETDAGKNVAISFIGWEEDS